MIERTFTPALALLIVLAPAACGDRVDELPDMRMPPIGATPLPGATDPGVPVSGGFLPSWLRVDGNRVELDIVAGATPLANHWNFNGVANGEMTITVPVGAEVTLRFRNDDPMAPHSIGVAPYSDSPPATPAPEPVFPGAISRNADSMTESTRTGRTETLTFTADRPGEYSLLCYVPGHGLVGMWVRFHVGESASVAGAPDVQISID